jgi:hypothetical protein
LEHPKRERGFCEDDVEEVKNAMLRMALTGDDDYDAIHAFTNETDIPSDAGHSKRKLKKRQ